MRDGDELIAAILIRLAVTEQSGLVPLVSKENIVAGCILIPDLYPSPLGLRSSSPRFILKAEESVVGLLDSVLGGLLGGNSGNASSPMGNILSNLLTGGGQGGGFNNAGGMGGSNNNGGMGGGLGSLISQFQNAGLGHVAQSWVGNGPNVPVSPGQLQDVFGEGQVQNMANQAGMQPGDFLSQLSQHLPAAVNGMTPNGQLPDEGSVSV